MEKGPGGLTAEQQAAATMRGVAFICSAPASDVR